MKLANLRIRNYRSIADLDLAFPTFYSAVCGKNDSGKSNILNAIRALFGDDEGYFNEEISIKDDLPKWLSKDSKDRSITISAQLLVFQESDAGLFKFLTDYLALQDAQNTLTIEIGCTFTADGGKPAVSLNVGGKEYEPLKAQEVLKKLQSSRSFLFHDSTELFQDYRYYRRFGGLLTGQLPPADGEKLESAKTKLSKTLGSITKRQQKDLGELLGRLREKYRVGISLQTFDLEYWPFSITLGDEAVSVGLEQWGSGTRNRTLMLMTLFKARRIGQAETSASKITPIIVIEEPESFLHPSAQAEFGKIIQDLSEEFQVQLIVASHSPYMLSQEKPESNVLLERHLDRHRLRDTRRVDTAGDRWMEPFALSLGLDNKQFEPWRDALFSKNDSILMVEGDTDKEYFEMLRDESHGSKRLKFSGEIYPYGGKDFLKQQRMVQFIKDRYQRCFITYDLDAEQELGSSLAAIGLQKGRHHCSIGIDQPGKRTIEGLLPDKVHAAVYSANAGLVQQATLGTSAEKRSAAGQLKRLYLQEFKRAASPGEDYKHFYALAQSIDKCLCEP